jgi:L-talarate/galactarate dehydratase
MKITHISAAVVLLPAEEPLAQGSLPPGQVRPTVILTIGTDAGIEGIGFTFLGAGLTRALCAVVEDLGGLMIGQDPLCRDALLRRAQTAAGGAGPAGLFTLGLAAIDIALWDIAGKALDQPLWKLLGGSGEPVPTYASGALMRGMPLDEVETASGRLVASGFRAMKMQLALPGWPGAAAELQRARVIRDTIGRDVALMCDINQRWRLDEAIPMGCLLEEIGFAWLEDVIAPEDFAGLARVSAALATPIAGGEYLYGLTAFRQMVAANAVDIVMIDPFRAGGVTQWLKIAALAEAFNLPVVSHLAPEIQVHLIGATPNGLTVEYMPWSIRLFEDVPRSEDGMLAMPTGAGLGLRYDQNAIARFRA